MSIQYQNEKLLDIPIPEDSVSLGRISASGINAYVLVDNILLGGNYSFPTVSITLKGITVPPLAKPGKGGTGDTFSFRGQSWVVLDVVEGAKFLIAGVEKYTSWTVTGVDLSEGRISIS